jgi:hypothetical protein
LATGAGASRFLPSTHPFSISMASDKEQQQARPVCVRSSPSAPLVSAVVQSTRSQRTLLTAVVGTWLSLPIGCEYANRQFSKYPCR